MGGSLQSGSDPSPAGSVGAAGEQLWVTVGNVPTGAPFVGKVVPEVESVVPPHLAANELVGL